MDFNYIPSIEAIYSINMNILPLTNNHAIIIYVKSNNGIKKKYSVMINYSNKSINEIYLENANGFVEYNIVLYKGFINIEKPDKEGIAI
ncbi:hypothetical protein RhiirA4_462903 [Rhizophagus irregularis]|uniref:Uncharacterized protein n=1 Tax=Rhizophagus irregularis TaxID=588596 RepID=A0A2I1GM43_9GLOM|nr:hypothetical protein RhiirA4_462903 [Rhizophagus irregularis]